MTLSTDSESKIYSNSSIFFSRFALGDSSRQLVVLPGEVDYDFLDYGEKGEILQVS